MQTLSQVLSVLPTTEESSSSNVRSTEPDYTPSSSNTNPTEPESFSSVLKPVEEPEEEPSSSVINSTHEKESTFAVNHTETESPTGDGLTDRQRQKLPNYTATTVSDCEDDDI
jgi:hypothetical protein